MDKSIRVTVLAALTLALALAVIAPVDGLAQAGARPAARKAGQRRAAVAPPSISTRVTWRMRTVVGHQDLLQWRVGIPANAFPRLTLWDAAFMADELGVGFIEAFSNQQVSPQIEKNLDAGLTPEEMKAVSDRLRSLSVRVAAYHVEKIGGDAASQRKLFELAKGLDAGMIVAAPDPALLPELDKLANEFEVNLALRGGARGETPAYGDPKALLAALEGRSPRIGVRADTGAWLQEGINPAEALSMLKGRLLAVNLRDRSAAGAHGRDVTLGSGAAAVSRLFGEMYRLGLKPLYLNVAPTGMVNGYVDLSRSLDGFEKAVQPVLTEQVDVVARNTPIKSTGVVPSEDREKIEAALPRQAQVKPKKPRKLLIMDLCVANYVHASIPWANLALELMGKWTGAYEPVFSNDLNNLKWDQIRQYDAVFLNNTVGELFPDPVIRESLLRYVREGGGLGGFHGASYASRNWPEFSEMLGASDAPHRIEPGRLKVDDPNSPINAAFGGKDMDYTEEYYRFPHSGPTAVYSREKLHVLLSVDAGNTDMIAARPLYVRPDHDHGLAWIKSYGTGRVFHNAMGHTTEFFMTPQLARHVLAGIQFILGDLEADTTPSAR